MIRVRRGLGQSERLFDGAASGPANGAQISSLQNVAVDSAGKVYIANSANQVIREVTAATGPPT